MDKSLILNLLKVVAIIGNVIYILWILINGIDEGFKAPIVQMVAYIGLLLLLILNIVLLVRKKS